MRSKGGKDRKEMVQEGKEKAEVIKINSINQIVASFVLAMPCIRKDELLVRNRKTG